MSEHRKGNSPRGTKRSVMDDAADWMVLIEDERASETELREFGDWLLASPENREAYDKVERAWQRVGGLSRSSIAASQASAEPAARADFGQSRPPPLSSGRAERRYRPFSGAAAFALASVVLCAVIWFLVLPDPIVHQTAIGEVREVRLEDGSRVIVGPGSTVHEIPPSVLNDARRVELIVGDAFFDVASDPDRPFLVTAGELQVRVTGTSFDVRHAVDYSQVGVATGTVSASYPTGPLGKVPLLDMQRKHVDLGAGQGIAATPAAGLGKTRRVQPKRVGAWRHRRMYYDDVPLAVIASDLARYQPVNIRIADAGAAELNVDGMFDSGDVASVLATLTEILPLHVERPSEGTFVIRSRP